MECGRRRTRLLLAAGLLLVLTPAASAVAQGVEADTVEGLVLEIIDSMAGATPEEEVDRFIDQALEGARAAETDRETLTGEWRFADIHNALMPPDTNTPPFFDVLEFKPDGTVRLQATLSGQEFVGPFELDGRTITWTFHPADSPQPIEHRVGYAWTDGGLALDLRPQAAESPENRVTWIFYRPERFLPNELIAGTWARLGEAGESAETLSIDADGGMRPSSGEYWAHGRLWHSGDDLMMTQLLATSHGGFVIFYKVALREDEMTLSGRMPPGFSGSPSVETWRRTLDSVTGGGACEDEYDGGLSCDRLERTSLDGEWRTRELLRAGVNVEIPTGVDEHFVWDSQEAVIGLHVAAPPRGVLDDARSLLEITLERMTREAFDERHASMFRTGMYKRSSDEDRLRLEWRVAWHGTIERDDSGGYTYYKHEIECPDTSVVRMHVELINLRREGVAVHEAEDDAAIRRILGSVECTESWTAVDP